MLLREMFDYSPLGGPKNDQEEVDWLGDLKFYIDNSDDVLTKHIFPAVRKHEKHVGHPEAYKFYLSPVINCLEDYCDKFEVEDIATKFPKEDLIKLAEHICQEQEHHINNGSYK